MFGGKKVNKQTAMQNIAKQKLMRGHATDANMIQNFGSLGEGAASQALSNSLRGNMQQTNTATTNTSTNKTVNMQKVQNITGVKKSDTKGSVGGSILGAIGK